MSQRFSLKVLDQRKGNVILKMALVSGGRSSLNPNAPLFVPCYMRQVEDFSPEWWNLVTTSTWFHDYWLSQHQGDVDGFFGNDEDADVVDLLPDTIDIDLGVDEDILNMEAQYEEFLLSAEAVQGKNSSPSVVRGKTENGFARDTSALVRNLSLSKERGLRSPIEPPRYYEKPAKYVSPKCSPRPIQQPR